MLWCTGKAFSLAVLAMLPSCVRCYATTDSTQDTDAPQSGYLPNHNMDPTLVGSSLSIAWKNTFNVNEVFYAKPLVYTPNGAPNEYVITVSNQNIVRIHDGLSGTLITSRTLLPPFQSTDTACGDIANTVGITGTPIIDTATDIMYFYSKSYKGGATGPFGTGGGAGVLQGQYQLYAVNIPSLTDVSGFPVTIDGHNANNDPTRYFLGGTVLQRPGLAMIGNTIVAGFGGHCDNWNYTGMLVAVSKTAGVGVTNIQAMEASPGAPSPQALDVTVQGGGKAGIWQSGMGLVADTTNNRVFFVTGNARGAGQNGGSGGKAASGKTYLSTLEQAVVNMGVDPNTGKLTQQDYFEPYAYDSNNGGDLDFGSAGVALLDPTVFFGTGVSRIAVAGGKDGKFYVMNADNLGGFAGGNAGQDNVIQSWTFAGGIRSGPASYPLEGGYIYVSPTPGSGNTRDFLYAYAFSRDANGKPVFTQAGKTAMTFDGQSVPTVTSNNGQPGTGIVWIADGTFGLRAFNAVPTNGVLTPINFPTSAATGGINKYQRAVFGNGRVYVTKTSQLLMLSGGGGKALSAALTCSPNPIAMGSVQVSQASTVQVTCTANAAISNPSPSIASKLYQVSAAGLPASVASGGTFTFPVTLNLTDANLEVYDNSTSTPLAPGAVGGSLNIYATAPSGYLQDTIITVSGTAVASAGYLVLNQTSISFGGVFVGGGSPSSSNGWVKLTNLGSTSLSFTGFAYQDYYAGMTYVNVSGSTVGNGFTSPSFPAVGSSLAAGASLVVPLVFSPSTTGIHASFLTFWSDVGGYITLAMQANAQQGTASSSSSVPPSTSSTSTSSTASTVSTASSVSTSASSTVSSTSSVPTTSSTITTASSTSPTGSTTSSVSTSSTTTSVHTGPSNLATIGTYSYVGCYTEATTGRALSALQYANNNMTIEICYATCSAAGYSWFGIEYHRECYCGNSLAAGSVPTTSGCTDTCMANPNEWCGGAKHLSMYNNLNPVIVSSSSSSAPTSTSSSVSSSSSLASSTSSSSSSLASSTSSSVSSAAPSSTSSSLSSSSSSSSSAASSSSSSTSSSMPTTLSTSTTSGSATTSTAGPVCSSPPPQATVAKPAPARRNYVWSVGWVNAAPDGYERPFVGINGQWPNPAISVNMGDTVIITVTNNLGNESTAIHFHGLHQQNTTYADGPSMVTQCPIQPGGTFVYEFIVNQPGTYWYHAHIGGQYIDGFRGPLIIHDVNAPYKVDAEYVMTISDLYHYEAPGLINYYQSYDNTLNNNGAEPVPNSLLINEAQNGQFAMVPGKKYLFRIINTGAFTPVYLQFDQHDMTVVEIDGVYVNQCTVSQLFITVAQRYSVIITAKATNTQNFAIKASMSTGMFAPEVIPATFNTEVSAFLVYNSAVALPAPITITPVPFDDSIYYPLDATPEFGPVTTPLFLTIDFTTNANGQRRGTLNDIDYVAPKVPTLYTAMNAPAANANDPTIYGTNTNPFVLPYNAVVELTLDNHDSNAHPFHLHGHNFQLISRSGGGSLFPYNAAAGAPPMRRDTIQVPGSGSITIRWVANNPGIQLFHCHIEWHVEAGLTATFIEAPSQIQAQKLYIPVSHRNVCQNQSIAMKGNAAGNTNYEVLTGQNTIVNASLWGSLVHPPSVPAGPYNLS